MVISFKLVCVGVQNWSLTPGMKGESVTRVGSNQRVCWERRKGESRTAERRVGNGGPKPEP